MASGNAIRGSRVGAGPMGEAERGESAPRIRMSYWCANGHETKPSFAEDTQVQAPETWDCPRCGFPASRPARPAQSFLEIWWCGWRMLPGTAFPGRP